MRENILHFLFLLFGLFVLIESSWISKRDTFLSQDIKRSHKRRSTFWDSLPGPPGQTLPTEVVQWIMSNQKCNVKEITQNITQTGCQPVSIRNKICYGICASIFVPGVPGTAEIGLCTECRPAGPKTSSPVTLKCAGGKTRTVNVDIVERCACSPCNAPRG